MIAALRQMFSLTAEQRAVFRRKVIEGKFTTGELTATLAPIARIDAVGDQGRKTGCGLLALLFIGLVVGLFLGLANDWSSQWFFGILVTFGLLFVLVMVLRLSLSAMDDPHNYLREVALPFLSGLSEDASPGKAFSVRMDFSPIKQKQKLDRVDKPPLPKGFTKLVNSYYKNPWFEGSAKLAIGGKLQWQVTDILCDSARTRRGSSGKYKIKNKSRIKTRLEVALMLPAARYEAVDAADPRVAMQGKWLAVTLAHKVLPQAESGSSVRAATNCERANVVDELINLCALAFNKVKPIKTPSRGAP